jgi:hypothetical protein
MLETVVAKIREGKIKKAIDVSISMGMYRKQESILIYSERNSQKS